MSGKNGFLAQILGSPGTKPGGIQCHSTTFVHCSHRAEDLETQCSFTGTGVKEPDLSNQDARDRGAGSGSVPESNVAVYRCSESIGMVVKVRAEHTSGLAYELRLANGTTLDEVRKTRRERVDSK